jgi:hypothetical protein
LALGGAGRLVRSRRSDWASNAQNDLSEMLVLPQAGERGRRLRQRVAADDRQMESPGYDRRPQVGPDAQ